MIKLLDDQGMADIRPLTPLSFQILVALADQNRHGYGIIQEIERAEGRPLASSSGTVYLAIQRLEDEQLLESCGREGRRRLYRLTAGGRRAAAREAERLDDLLAVARSKDLFGEVG